MKIAILSLALLSGCATSGLNVAWVFQASYNTATQTGALITSPAPDKK